MEGVLVAGATFQFPGNRGLPCVDPEGENWSKKGWASSSSLESFGFTRDTQESDSKAEGKSVVNSAAMNIGVHLSFKLWFPLDVCPGVGLMDHIVALFLIF